MEIFDSNQFTRLIRSTSKSKSNFSILIYRVCIILRQTAIEERLQHTELNLVHSSSAYIEVPVVLSLPKM